MNKRIWSVLLAATLLLSQTVPSMTVQAATKLTLTKSEVSMYVGTKTTVRPKSKAVSQYTCSSSNAKVVKVSKKGTLKAVKAGTATVTVKAGSNRKASCQITVGAYAKKLRLESAATVILAEGATSQIKATVTPAKVLNSGILYESLDTGVATVDENGNITAVVAGMTQITLTSVAVNKNDKNLTKTIQIIVNEKEEDTESSTGGGTSATGETQETEDATEVPLIDTIQEGAVTTYILNKSYTSSVTVTMTVDGNSFRYTGKVARVLNDISSTYTTRTNSAGTICVSRSVNDEWWTVTDPSNDDAVLFYLKADESLSSNASYGQIQIEQVSGSVSVEVE